ncbi:MAG: serine/threonine-protein kinase, partial [Myxococcota bacterium]
MSERQPQDRPDAEERRVPDEDEASGLAISWPSLSAMVENRRLKEILRSQLFGHSEGPTRIGRFAVRRQLGSGGMGVVYAGYDEELEREVAIKLLLSSNQGEAARSRLVREAKVMAQLSHPNVVQVYEVGHHDGQDFVAMELVVGQTLREWQLAEDRDWREILAIYIQAGHGLAAAHAVGIVHRDFKPDNVLVGEDGRPRVGDFGLAHTPLSDPAATQAAAEPPDLSDGSRADSITRSGAFLGTIVYMSPEQFLGGTTCQRSDQFSFCVALYEALYGRRPFAGDSIETVADAVVSGRIRAVPAGSKVPPRIHAAVLRGLSRESDERWPDMAALLAELGRDGRKKRVAAAIAATLIVGVGVGIAAAGPILTSEVTPPCLSAGQELASTWNAQRKSSIGRAFARSSLPYATTVWVSARDSLDAYAARWSAARKTGCEATLVQHTQSQEAYDLQTACLLRRRIEFDAVVAALSQPDDTIIENAAQLGASMPELESCDDIERLRLGIRLPGDAETFARVTALRRDIARASSLRNAGKYRDGLSIAERAVAAARTSAYPPVLAEALFEMGALRDDLGQGGAAVEALLEALDVAEANRHDELAARAWTRLILVGALRIKQSARAHEWFRRARAAIARLGRERGEYEPLWAEALDRLGLVYLLLDHSAEQAETQHRRALDIRRRVFGPRHLTVAHSLSNLANALAANKRGRAEALELYERALHIYQELEGPEHPDVASILFDIGLVRVKMGNFAEARDLYQRALAVYRRTYGERNPRTANILTALAQLEVRAGALATAHEYIQAALRIHEAELPPDHRDRLQALTLLALVLYREKKYDQALVHYREILA